MDLSCLQFVTNLARHWHMVAHLGLTRPGSGNRKDKVIAINFTKKIQTCWQFTFSFSVHKQKITLFTQHFFQKFFPILKFYSTVGVASTLQSPGVFMQGMCVTLMACRQHWTSASEKRKEGVLVPGVNTAIVLEPCV